MKNILWLLSASLIVTSCGSLYGESVVPQVPKKKDEAYPVGIDMTTADGGRLSYPIFDENLKDIFELGEIPPCKPPFDSTGLMWRIFSQDSKPAMDMLKANYISAELYVPTYQTIIDGKTIYNYSLKPYLTPPVKGVSPAKPDTEYPTPYWYFGGSGDGLRGWQTDVGLSYSRVEGDNLGYLRVYAQAHSYQEKEAIAISTKGQIKNQKGEIQKGIAYRIPAGQNLALKFYIDKNNDVVFDITANKIKYLAANTKDIPENYSDYQGNNIQIRINKDTYAESMTTKKSASLDKWGWVYIPKGTTDKSGQHIKIVHSLAYNLPSGMSEEEKKSWIRGRADYVYNSSFSNIVLGTRLLEKGKYIIKPMNNWMPYADKCISEGVIEEKGVLGIFAPKAKRLRFQVPPKKSSKTVLNETGRNIWSIIALPVTPLPIFSLPNFEFKNSIPKSLSAQSIVVTPKFEPSSGPMNSADADGTFKKQIEMLTTCGNVAGVQPPTPVTLTDPTGLTEETEFMVEVNCVGPQISQPSDMMISAYVGETASGSFSFSNTGEVDDLGRVAALNFDTMKVNQSIKLNPTSGILSKNPTTNTDNLNQTVQVSMFCSTPGENTNSVTIYSRNSQDGSIAKSFKVTVKCREKREPIKTTVMLYSEYMSSQNGVGYSYDSEGNFKGYYYLWSAQFAISPNVGNAYNYSSGYYMPYGSIVGGLVYEEYHSCQSPVSMEYPNYDGELKQKIQECLDEKMVGVLQRYAVEAEKAIMNNRERLCKYPNCEIVNFRLDKHPAFGNRGYFVDIIEHP